MNEWDKEKQQRFNSILFTIKILALLFCTSPVFQYYFTENAMHVWSDFNFMRPLLLLLIILLVVLLWFVVNFKTSKNSYYRFIEIAVYYFICFVAVMYSGANESYYKYMFVFMTVVYTMDYGFTWGAVVTTVSSITILAIDVIMYKGDGINPFFQSDIALCATFFLIAWVLGFYVKIENEHIRELKNQANIDFLTGAYNHRYFYDILEKKFKEDANCKHALSFIMIDIDYFKVYNDLYGHQLGDDILKEIIHVIKVCSRPGDIICRYGGEEFAVIYPDTTQDEAIKYADNIRKKISEYGFKGQELMPNQNLTVSIGVSQRRKSDESVRTFIERGDTALYRAKFFRKNRVELYTSVFEQFSDIDKNVENDKNMDSVKALITIINSRDHYTYSHTERVVIYSQTLADYLNLDINAKRHLVYAAYLHDIGKINISKEVLIADHRLNEQDWEEVARHPVDGADIISQMKNMDKEIAEIVRQHHERYDGSGYPLGLKGEKINILSRMLSIADSFDAMTSNRPYQRQLRYEEAFAELERCKGTQFDPSLVDDFIHAINEKL